MNLIMAISGKEIISVEFDFIGYETIQSREEFVQDLTWTMRTEYEKEIREQGGEVEFYYHANSMVDFIKLSNFDMKAFEIKIRAAKFNREKLSNNEK